MVANSSRIRPGLLSALLVLTVGASPALGDFPGPLGPVTGAAPAVMSASCLQGDSSVVGCQEWVYREVAPTVQSGASDVRFQRCVFSPDSKTVYLTGVARNAQLIVVRSLDAQTGGPLWHRSIPTTGSSVWLDSAISASGKSIFVSFGDHNVTGDNVIRLVALDAATGSTIWDTATVSGAGVAGDPVGRLHLSPNGKRIFIGANRATGLPVVAAYRTTSGVPSIFPVNSTLSSSHLVDVVVTPNAQQLRVLMATITFSGGDYDQTAYEIVALSARTGQVKWRASGVGAHESGWSALAQSADGSTLALMGVAWTPATHEDIAFVGVSGATGAQLWNMTWDGPGHYTDLGQQITFGPNNQLYALATAWATVSGTANPYLDQTSVIPWRATVLSIGGATGHLSWQQLVSTGPLSTELADGLRISSDGSQAVLSFTYTDPGIVGQTGFREGRGAVARLNTTTGTVDSMASFGLTDGDATAPALQGVVTDVGLSPDGAHAVFLGAFVDSAGNSSYLAASFAREPTLRVEKGPPP
ncbi:MAG: outer membrane protein assembly factor BamB family protein [Thermoplasmatota archaeon]